MPRIILSMSFCSSIAGSSASYRPKVKIWLLGALALVAVSCAPEATPDTLVYVTEDGAKYHRKECRLKQGSKGIRLGDLPQKYTACSRCDPPVLKS